MCAVLGESGAYGSFQVTTGMEMMDYRIRTLDEYRELRGDAHPMNYDKSVGVIDDLTREQVTELAQHHYENDVYPSQND
jgi:hypothetical protein